MIIQIVTIFFLDFSVEKPTCTGWEKNYNSKTKERYYGPGQSNLKDQMRPERLAEQASQLNLKLMKWRVAPSLDLEIFGKTKCLLLGMGTLGCNVARLLVAWGVRDLEILDNGNVRLLVSVINFYASN